MWSIAAGIYGLLLLCSLPLAQQPNEEELARLSITQLAKQHKSWGPGLNSPGVSLSLKETEREKRPGLTAVIYQLYVTGMPNDQKYALVFWELNEQPKEALNGITLDPTGRAICAGKPDTCGGDKPDDPIDLVVFAARGEPKRFALVSDDQQYMGVISVVPFPMRSTDHGCSVEAVLLLRNAEAVLVKARGFDPNSEILVTGKSLGESHQQTVKADDNGEYEHVALPYVKGRANGQTTETFKAQKCTPSITYPWGKDSYHLE